MLFRSRDIDKIADKMELDLGEYSPELGFSYNEIAGMSRSQHRSQAMGTAERKGPVKNYFVTEKGDKAKTDIFDGINIGWSRVDGGAAVTTLVEQAQKSFDPAHPENLLPVLAKLRPVMASVAASSQNPLAQLKLQKLDEAIADAGGRAEFVACNVTNEEEVRALMEGTVAKHGRLDILANVAGVMPLPKGMAVKGMENPPVTFNVVEAIDAARKAGRSDIVYPESIPQWIQDVCSKSEEYVQFINGVLAEPPAPAADEGMPEINEEVPF